MIKYRRPARRGETDIQTDQGVIVPPGVWLKVSANRSSKPQSAVFLDRDGVIVEDPGYLARPSDVQLVSGAARLISAVNAANRPVVVITNQSGIVRGYFDWDTFARVQWEIEHQLEKENAWLSAVVACPFHPDFTDNYKEAFDGWRKPGPKMLWLAAERLNIDLRHSALVGDHLADVSAARAAGLGGSVLVLTGHGRSHAEAVGAFDEPTFRVLVADGPAAAIEPLRQFGLLT